MASSNSRSSCDSELPQNNVGDVSIRSVSSRAGALGKRREYKLSVLISHVVLKLYQAMDEILEVLRLTREQEVRNLQLFKQTIADQAAKQEEIIAILKSMSVSFLVSSYRDIYLLFIFMLASQLSTRRLRGSSIRTCSCPHRYPFHDLLYVELHHMTFL